MSTKHLSSVQSRTAYAYQYIQSVCNVHVTFTCLELCALSRYLNADRTRQDAVHMPWMSLASSSYQLSY
jgi:hypothetical protein